ncbi:MAG: hypothetical protein ACR2KL_02855 [Nocardioidaceae bacterium]
MAWTWRLEDAAGEPVAAAEAGDPSFPSRADAESWVGECWQELAEAGVDQVRLFEDEREVYGPMSLHSP